jgi:hypothetical protein
MPVLVPVLHWSGAAIATILTACYTEMSGGASGAEAAVSPKRPRRDQHLNSCGGDGESSDSAVSTEQRWEQALPDTRPSCRFEEYSAQERRLIDGLVDTYNGHLVDEEKGDELFHDEDGSIILAIFMHHFITCKTIYRNQFM